MKSLLALIKVGFMAYAMHYLGWASQAEAFIAAVCINILIEVTK